MPIAHISPNRRPMHVNLDPAVLDQALHSDSLYGIQRGALSPAAVKVLMRSARTKRFNLAVVLEPGDERLRSSVTRRDTFATSMRHPELSLIMDATRRAMQLAARCSSMDFPKALERWGDRPEADRVATGQRLLGSVFHELGPGGSIAGHRDDPVLAQFATAVYTLEGQRTYRLKGRNDFQAEEVTRPGDLVLIGSGNHHGIQNLEREYSTSCVVAYARV